MATFLACRAFISLIITVVVVSTYWTLFNQFYLGHATDQSLIASLSFVESTKALFRSKSAEPLSKQMADLYRLVMILLGLAAHTVVCLEMPISFYMIGNYETLISANSTLT